MRMIFFFSSIARLLIFLLKKIICCYFFMNNLLIVSMICFIYYSGCGNDCNYRWLKKIDKFAFFVLVFFLHLSTARITCKMGDLKLLPYYYWHSISELYFECLEFVNCYNFLLPLYFVTKDISLY